MFTCYWCDVFGKFTKEHCSHCLYTPLTINTRYTEFFVSLDIRFSLQVIYREFICTLSPGQTIATCQRNMSQHCWAQHVALACCDRLPGALKPRPNDRNTPTQHIATLLGATCCVRLATVLRQVGCCWLKFETGQI